MNKFRHVIATVLSRGFFPKGKEKKYVYIYVCVCVSIYYVRANCEGRIITIKS